MLCYNIDVESFCERLSTAPSRINLSSKFISREGLQMLNNQTPTPVLMEDLGMLYPTEKSKKKKRFGMYRCSCGVEFMVIINSVKSGATKSCGCFKIKCLKETKTTHGLRHHPLYRVWASIIQRATNEKDQAYKNYGGRGITVCEEWKNEFMAFYNWATANGYERGLEIDRRNNDEWYSPDNCRFVTKSINMRNTRTIMSTNTSKYRGVSFHKQHKKWRATIRVNNKTKHLGYFETAIDSAKAYDTYIIENNLEHTRNFKEYK